MRCQTIENTIHFGVGSTTVVDSVVVVWPNAKKQTLQNIATNKTITIDIAQANAAANYTAMPVAVNNLFTDITKASGINYFASEVDFIDFNIQKLLPHKFTEYTPGIATGDINGDGLDDFEKSMSYQGILKATKRVKNLEKFDIAEEKIRLAHHCTYFHEALNTAAVWDLPVIFIIENNGYGLSTPVNEQYRCKNLVDKAAGYGIEGIQIDGNNILSVFDTIKGVRDHCIKNQKPYLIECMTFRMRGHEEASGTKYVPKELFEQWEKKDPVKNFEQFLSLF